MILAPVGIFNRRIDSFRHAVTGNTADDGADGRSCDGADRSCDSSHRGTGCGATSDGADSSSYNM
jgi:hypothetical protein